MSGTRAAPEVSMSAACTAAACARPVYALGLCSSHYARPRDDTSPLRRYSRGSGRVSLRLPAEVIVALRATTARTGQSVTAVVEAALRAHLSDIQTV